MTTRDLFPSVDALRDAHAELINLVPEDHLAPADHDLVREFIVRASRSGAVLAIRSDRTAAQGILNYWVNVHAAAAGSPPLDPGRTVLVSFDTDWADALEGAAEAVYAGLPADLDREVTRGVFLDLVQPRAGPEVVRRRARREDLRRHADSARVDAVLAAWVTAGLLREVRAGAEPGPHEDDLFEVAYEALTRNWRRLADWLAEQRQAEAQVIALAGAAELWRKSGRATGYLLTGTALADARPYAGRSALVAELVRAGEAYELGRQRAFRGVMTGAVTVLLGGVLLLGYLYSEERASQRRAQANRRLAAFQYAQRKRALVDDRRSEQATSGLLQRQIEQLRRELAIAKKVDPPPKSEVRRPPQVRPAVRIGTATRQGVVTAIVTDRAGPEQAARRLYLLTLPMVVADRPEASQPVFQFPVPDTPPAEADRVARVTRWVGAADGPVSPTIGLVAELDPRVRWNPSVFAFGPIAQAGEAEPGAVVRVVGVQGLIKTGRVVAARGRLTAFPKLDNVITLQAATGPRPGPAGRKGPDDGGKVGGPVSVKGDAGAPV